MKLYYIFGRRFIASIPYPVIFLENIIEVIFCLFLFYIRNIIKYR